MWGKMNQMGKKTIIVWSLLDRTDIKTISWLMTRRMKILLNTQAHWTGKMKRTDGPLWL